MNAIGNDAFSAAMNRYVLTGLALPGEEGRGFFQQVALHAKGPVLTTEPS
jgi:hypothetical protein